MPAFQPYYYYKTTTYPGTTFKFTPSNKRKTVISKLLLNLGIITLIWVSYPIISFQLFHSRKFAQNQFISPLGADTSMLTFAANNSNNPIDYTKAENWFPEFPTTQINSDLTEYTLSIPKLNIESAKVSLVNENLSQNLVHYGGTALPGNNGNGVIFGHSILPQFYNPQNYIAIFSTLHTLELGDQILTTIDGIIYQYQVIDMFEVSPKDISVLEQTYDSQYLTLITCTPPGTYLRRLIVKAKLIPYQQKIEPT